MTSFVLEPSDDPVQCNYRLNGFFLMDPGNYSEERPDHISPLMRPWLIMPDGSNLADLLTQFPSIDVNKEADAPTVLWDNGYVVNTGYHIINDSLYFDPWEMFDDFDTLWRECEERGEDIGEFVDNYIMKTKILDFYGYPEGFSDLVYIGCDEGIENTEIRFRSHKCTRRVEDHEEDFNITGENLMYAGVRGLPTPGEWVFMFLTATYILGNMDIIESLINDPVGCFDLHYSARGMDFATAFYEVPKNEIFGPSTYANPEEYLAALSEILQSPKFGQALDIIRNTDYAQG